MPAIHTQVAPAARVDFAAKVTMMCGCQVATGGYWPDGDFEVRTYVQEITAQGLGAVTLCKMGLLEMPGAPPSTFGTETKVQHFNVPLSGSGTVFYQASICARQKSTGNSGTATLNFFCVY